MVATCLAILFPASAQAATPDPVILVHGYGGLQFSSLPASLRANGWPADRIFEFNYNYNQSNEISAAQLASFVEQVKARTGAAKVDLVSHSMGGLVTRWYVKFLGGADSVDDFASAAGANHGTTAAAACLIFASCQEMLPGSAFLNRLNSGDETPGSVNYGTWYSACDGVIIPYTSTLLDGATNTDVGCVSHLEFLSNTSIDNRIIQFIR